MTGNNKNDFSTFKERDKAAEKLMSLDGWQTGRKIERLEISIFIFRGNLEDIMKRIEFFKSPSSLILQDVRNRDELHQFFKEITRLLHNYLASAMTLVDHTRILVRELYDGENFSQFKDEYDSKKMICFAENPLHQFIQGLRNYIIHKELPVIGSILNLNEIKSDLIIDISELRNNFEWNKFAKEFMDSKNDDEKLESIVLDYFKLVLDFHDWFYARQLEVHSEIFKEANDLRERIHNSRWTIKM